MLAAPKSDAKSVSRREDADCKRAARLTAGSTATNVQMKTGEKGFWFEFEILNQTHKFLNLARYFSNMVQIFFNLVQII